MSEDRVPYYTDAYRPLTPVLQIPREELRRGVRDTLFILHQERVSWSDPVGRPFILEQIRFWEAVLGWIQTQRGETLNLVGHAEG